MVAETFRKIKVTDCCHSAASLISRTCTHFRPCTPLIAVINFNRAKISLLYTIVCFVSTWITLQNLFGTFVYSLLFAQLVTLFRLWEFNRQQSQCRRQKGLLSLVKA